MKSRTVIMAAPRTVPFEMRPNGDTPPLEPDEIAVSVSDGGIAELVLIGTPQEIALFAERIHHVAGRAHRIHEEASE